MVDNETPSDASSPDEATPDVAAQPAGGVTDAWADDDGSAPAEPDAWADDGPDAPAEAGPDDATRKRNVLIAQVALVVVSLLVVAVVLIANNGDDSDSDASKSDAKTTTTVAGADGTAKGKAAWPSTVEGRPPALGKRGQTADKVDASKAKPGVYVWSDFDGWHMWVVGGKGMPERLNGSLTSNDELSRADLAVPDTGTVEAKGVKANFDLDTTKGLTGMDFSTGFYGKRLVFTFEGPDGPVDVALIKTGSKSAQGAYPLVIDKS